MMSQNQKTTAAAVRRPVIILTGGGSGGHITPILSLVPELKRLSPDCRLVYVGLKGERLSGLDTQLTVFDEVYRVTSGKLRRFAGRSRLAHLLDLKSLILNFRDLFKVLAGTWQARRLLRKIHPDVVFSKGGYVVVPVGLAARLARVPIVTHDSDAVPGLANRLVGRWAKAQATGMPAELYDYPAETTHYVGVPLNPKIKPVDSQLQQSYKKQIGLATDSLVLLIGGAGLGSQTLNDLAVAAAPQLLEHFEKLQIIHLSGAKHEAAVKADYQRHLNPQQQKQVEVMAFTDDFYVYSGAADLIVSRAGATSLAEFAAQAKACVIIPAPWLPGGQQTHNAKALEKQGAAVVLDDKVSPQDFTEQLRALLGDEAQRRQLGQRLAKLAKPSAAAELAELILKVAAHETI